MKRRLFLQSSVSSIVAAPALAHTGSQGGVNASGSFFYDTRFDEARGIARSVSPFGSLTPVNGDLSAEWVKEVIHAAAKSPQTFRGVTTESFYFCLRTLLQPRRIASAHIERVGRDLYAWEIRTTSKDGMA
ncbi:hypothetical protein [Hyphococcus sp.]|jgi:hypothetical protein|uniref:hypothetical protein n=1 Tax=Hyphococcus sp. TaxID=2038636 RepID=UPI003D0F1195